MLLWRLSGKQHAQALDGGYGLHFDGRWNTVGHAVTYCATSPALCVLEKLVHIEDPALLPELVMVCYEVPDGVPVQDVRLTDLPADWRRNEAWSQERGDAWHEGRSTLLLRVPSAIVPIGGSPDLNVLINQGHAAAANVRIIDQEPFSLDPRLF
ncbi:RES family NAD+ phosphorylase [Pseudaminobacter soli (ex Li et al. 2025)]|uniref:RES domain-containing protein n=1 Tax=Pseudaminobacter soli (ex Li et al. 2025) TaxID=1295366 RepID=A0A2P7S900_9HYPH|nr:RES family NAD+ phosphorylase [Mesorhizobium soli]PSJ58947.1 RES domain-containing protein [Mesorhizobium soli]